MHIQSQPVPQDAEVSKVSNIALEPISQDATTMKGKSFKTTEPSSWFQSMTDHFKEALSQQVTAISFNTTFLCFDQPL